MSSIILLALSHDNNVARSNSMRMNDSVPSRLTCDPIGVERCVNTNTFQLFSQAVFILSLLYHRLASSLASSLFSLVVLEYFII